MKRNQSDEDHNRDNEGESEIKRTIKLRKMHPEDKEIISFKKAFPNENVLKILDRYKQEANFPDYYSALDSMTYKVGISFGHIPVDDVKTNKQIGYVPYINYSGENELNEPQGKQTLVPYNGPFKNLEDSKYCVIKEVIYRLRNISNLEKLIFPK